MNGLGLAICQILAGDEEGGLEKHVVELSNALARHGHRVTVIAHEKYRDRFSPAVVFEAQDLSRGRNNPWALWRLRQAIVRHAPAVVHAHANKAAAMVSRVLPFLRVASVATLHSTKRSTRMFRRFDHVIAVSRTAVRHLNHPAVTIVHNGIASPPRVDIDTEALRAQLGVPAGAPVVLAIGRAVPVKGFDLLIGAWQGIDAHLLIAGEGPDLPALQRQAAALGLTDRVHLLGQRRDIFPLLALASFLVISSRWEGCPYTLIEALLAGHPVVSTAVGPVPDWLPDRWVVPVEDVPALHGALVSAIRLGDSLAGDFQAAFRMAQDELTLDAMVDRTVAVYRDVLARRTPS